VVFEAGPLQLSVDGNLARSQHEVLVDELERLVSETRRKKRTEVASPVIDDPPHEHSLGIRLVRDLDVRVALVVLQMDVIARLVNLDEIRLEY
jgi:hypothetical protein